MPTSTETIERMASQEYKWGWSVNMDADEAPLGLNEDIIRFISHKKEEPEWLLEWRLKAYRPWLTMTEAQWGKTP
jgi:Fe-S cluster assembly protein SufB